MPFEIQHKNFNAIWRSADRRIVFAIDARQVVARKSINMA